MLILKMLLVSGDVHFAESNQVKCGTPENVLSEITSSGLTHSWVRKCIITCFFFQ